MSKARSGRSKAKFKDLFPDALALHEALDDANDVRNSIAHDCFLVSWFVQEILKEKDKGDIARFNHKTLEKHLYIIDSCLIEFVKFQKSNKTTAEAFKKAPK